MRKNVKSEKLQIHKYNNTIKSIKIGQKVYAKSKLLKLLSREISPNKNAIIQLN